MTPVLMKVVQGDPTKYPFKAQNDRQAHLDTDELRRTIKPVFSHIPTDFAGQEHLYCDPDQLDANGAYRTPKVMLQAKARGFSDPIAMNAADQKAAQDAKDATITNQQSQITTLQSTIGSQTTQIGSLQTQLSALANSFQTYITAVHGTGTTVSS